jgi:hypothetical protein
VELSDLHGAVAGWDRKYDKLKSVLRRCLKNKEELITWCKYGRKKKEC